MALSPSRPSTPSFFNFGTPPPLSFSLRSPGLHTGYAGVKEEHDFIASPRPRASSDPPPSSHAVVDKAHLSLEPNPFEQSFSASSIPPSVTRSTALENQLEHKTANRRARSHTPPSLTTKNQFANSPSFLEGQNWLNESIRAPLSPSPGQHPTAGFSASFASLFDPNSFKTGLTPGGVTTGFLPQSPNTQAMFAMMTNQFDTPNTSGQTTAQAKAGLPIHAPAPSLAEPNHFDLGFGSVMQNGRNSTRHPAIVQKQTLENGQLPPTFATHTQAKPRPISFNPAKSVGSINNGNVHPSLIGRPNPFMYNENTGHTDQDEVIAAGVLSALNTGYSSDEINFGNETSSARAAAGQLFADHITNNGMNANSLQNNLLPYGGSVARKSANSEESLPRTASTTTTTRKRKAQTQPTAEEIALIDPDIPPPATRGRKKGSTNKKAKAKQNYSNDEEDDAGEMDGNNSNNQVFETEEDKRKNFLERNRQAALKCRQRKKAWLTSLQSKVEVLTGENETLQSTIQQLKDELGAMRSILMAHKDCTMIGTHGNGHLPIGSMLNGRQY